MSGTKIGSWDIDMDDEGNLTFTYTRPEGEKKTIARLQPNGDFVTSGDVLCGGYPDPLLVHRKKDE